MADSSYLKPKAGAPEMIRDKRNGQFRNPPAYNEGMSGFTSASKVPGEPGKIMSLERGGPQAKRGKPI
jgi:hypothetical protein